MGINISPKLSTREKIADYLAKAGSPDKKIDLMISTQEPLSAADAVFMGERLEKMENTALIFGSDFLTNEGLSIVAPYVSKMKNLTHLDMGGTAFGSSAFGDFTSCLPQSKITTLNIAGDELYSSAIQDLARVLPRTELRSINLGRNNVDDSAITTIGENLKKAKLEELMLQRNCFTDKGVKSFVSYLPESRIKTLYLNNNNLSAESTKALAAILPQTVVEELVLSENKIGNEGIKELAKALPDSKVTKLQLFSCGITDEGAKHLLVALQNPNCRVSQLNVGAPQKWCAGELDVSACVSPEMLDLLSKAAANNAARIAQMEKDKEDKQSANTPDQITAEVRSAKPEDIIQKGLLIKAAYAGCLPEVVSELTAKGQTPSADLLLAQDENGCSPISLICEQKRLAALLTADNFKNAQDVQKIWNAVSVEGKEQMDGQDGRPNFQRVKNQIMTNAVKAAVAGKAKQGR